MTILRLVNNLPPIPAVARHVSGRKIGRRTELYACMLCFGRVSLGHAPRRQPGRIADNAR